MRKKRSPSSILLAIVLSGFAAGFVTAGLALPEYFASQNSSVVAASIPQASLIKLVQSVSPGVVSITSTQGDERVFGSGFFATSDGIVITCAHVVKDTGTNYEITTQDNKTFPVKVLSRHENEDIAFLKVDSSSLPALKLGDSNSLKPGEEIVTIGNPFGILDNTVSRGIVSGVHRDIIAMDQNDKYQEGLNDVIQIDASLNPGESGGPLLNMSGEVVGMNAASDTRAQNISFAIPVNVIKRIGLLDGIRFNFRLQ